MPIVVHFHGMVGHPVVILSVQGVDVLSQEVDVIHVIHYDLHHWDKERRLWPGKMWMEINN